MDNDNIYFIGAFPQVSETFIVRQVSYLNSIVITNRYLENNVKYYDLSGIRVIQVAAPYSRIQTFIDRIYSRLFYYFYQTPLYYWKKKELQNAVKSIEALPSKPKVIFASFGTHGINAMKISAQTGIPLIVQFMGFDASKYLKYERYVNELKIMFTYAKAIVVLNQAMSKRLLAIGCPQDKIHVINIGVPVFDITPIDMKKGERFRFIAIGRFVYKKAPLDTIKAFELCADRNANVELIFVGDGELKKEVDEYCKQSRHANKIHLLGYKSQAEIKELFADSNVFVQHSVTAADGDQEGWPVAIADAASYGLPIVSTLHGGIPEQVIHGKTGYLVEEHDFQSMGEFMYELSKDFSKCKEMGLQSRKHIEVHGDILVQLEKLKRLMY